MANEPTPGNGRINGDDEKNDLHGTPRRDEIDGWGNRDTIWGKGDNDTLWGGNGRDRIYGEDGNDTLWGGRGDDWLYGGNGNDVLVGGLDDDYLFGGAGTDILVGMAGHDELTGGDGTDRFEFVIADYSNGNDTIKDFENGEEIHFVNFKKGSNPIDITVFQVGNDTRIEYGSGKNFSTITLTGVGVDEVSKADFVGVGSLFRGVDVTATPAAEPVQATGSKENFLVKVGNEISKRADSIVGFSNGDDAITFRNGASEASIDVTISQVAVEVGGGTRLDTLIEYGDSSITLENVVALDITRADLGGIGTITRKIDGTESVDRELQSTEDNDIISGKGGSDHFVFDTSISNGKDVITDFTKDDKETIVFRNGDANSSTDVTISQVGQNTLIEYGDSSITLKGKDALEIGKGQFAGLGTITRKINDTDNPNSSFRGTADNDVMDGMGGNDKIYGLIGDDTLKGGDGADLLAGGTGNDTLTGGDGKDFFVFDGNGFDIVTDFEFNKTGSTREERVEDRIRIEGLDYDDLVISQVGANALITNKAGTFSVTVENFDHSELTEGSGIFDFVDVA